LLTTARLKRRLKELNEKAYYLLVALSFLYGKTSQSTSTTSLKWAITLTALVAVTPVQDYVPNESCLGCIRFVKVAVLIAALVLTIVWVWTTGAATQIAT
jgi:hypothetical protein